MSIFKLTSEGTWYIRSESDERWNVSGRAHVGGFMMPPEIEQKLEELKEKYGNPPSDCEWGYMKD